MALCVGSLAFALLGDYLFWKIFKSVRLYQQSYAIYNSFVINIKKEIIVCTTCGLNNQTVITAPVAVGIVTVKAYHNKHEQKLK